MAATQVFLEAKPVVRGSQNITDIESINYAMFKNLGNNRTNRNTSKIVTGQYFCTSILNFGMGTI